MARRSGLGRGLGALIPTDIMSGDAGSGLREVPVGSISPNPHQPRAYFDEEALASLTASDRGAGRAPARPRPGGRRRALRADRGGAALAGGQAGRAAVHPRGRADRRRRALPRAGPGGEPAPRGPQPAGGGGRLPAAHGGLRADPGGGGPEGGQVALGGRQHAAPLPAPARRSSGSWPRTSWRPATPRPCWARPIGPSRTSWPSRSWPTACRSARPRRRCAATTRSSTRSRRTAARRGAGRRPSPRRPRLRAPGLLELEELLAAHLDTRVTRLDGRRRRQGQGRGGVRGPRGPRADLPGHDRRRRRLNRRPQRTRPSTSRRGSRGSTQG